MSREIKFRAFAQFDKTWHYWDVYGEYPQGVYGGLSPPQQYTGLKDKNGVEIYECDILKSSSGDLSIVQWVKSYSGYQFSKCVIATGKPIDYYGGMGFTSNDQLEFEEVICSFYELPIYSNNDIISHINSVEKKFIEQIGSNSNNASID